MTHATVGLTAMLLLLSGCGGGVIQRADEAPPPPPGYGYLEIKCAPKTAEVYVDGRYLGRLDGYVHATLRLPEGQRRVELRAPDHYSWFGVLQVGPTLTRVQTHLVPQVP